MPNLPSLHNFTDLPNDASVRDTKITTVCSKH